MHKVKSWFKTYSLPILSGVLIGTSYIPFPPWAILFCFVPLWIHWQRHPHLKDVFISGWITQFVLTLIGFYWIAHTVHEFGQLPWAISVLALLAYCCFGSLHIPLAGVFAGLIKKYLPRSEIALIIAWIAFLSLTEKYYPAIFKWNFGYPWFWVHVPIYNWADVIGFSGLSSVTFIFNGLLFWTWNHRRERTRAGWGLACTLIAFIALSGAGWLHGQKWEHPSDHLRIAAVQPNIGDYEKVYNTFGNQYEDVILDKELKLSSNALKEFPNIQLIMWPETAFPDFLDPGTWRGPYAPTLMNFVRASHVALLTGAYSRDLGYSRTQYNGLFLVDSDGAIREPPYRKADLLAFGEHFPLGDYFPILYRWIPTVGDFGRGRGPMLLHLGNIRLGPQICYEGLDEHLSRKLALMGAQVFVNVTNDSWYGIGFEPYQHLYMTLARGVENRRPLIRVTNSGISAAVLASGKVLQRSPMGQEWAGIYDIAYDGNPPLTFYSRFGGWIPLFWVFTLLGLLIRKRLWTV